MGRGADMWTQTLRVGRERATRPAPAPRGAGWRLAVGGRVADGGALEEARMSTVSSRQRMLSRTEVERASAEALLHSLIDAREAVTRGLRTLKRPDLLRQGQGTAPVDAAIEGTRRLIESYNRILHELSNDLSDEEVALLDEITRAR